MRNRKTVCENGYTLGDTMHSSNNGDSYPFRIINISKSGKSIQVVAMDYTALKMPNGESYPYGDGRWECFDYPLTQAHCETGLTYTLRKNGRWIRQGCTLNAWYMGLHKGAYYSYNFHV